MQPDPRFMQPNYLIRRQVLSLLGQKFHVYGPEGMNGPVLLFCKQKAFKLREDIRLYESEACAQEVLVIQARQIIDWGAAYDVWDPVAQVKVGALRRKGLKSIVRDSWQLLDAHDRQFGTVEEDSTGMALARRILSNLIPQSFDIRVGNDVVAQLHQRFNPFIYKLEVDFRRDQRGVLDRRLGLAAAILIATIEGRQD